MSNKAGQAWDREYAAGRYEGEPPVPFVHDLLAAAREHDLAGRPGLYIGCGNGRNYLPLVAAGLDLVGLDISPTAINQLQERAPDRAGKLICGDLSALSPGEQFELVIGIQVFQHGDRETSHRHIRAAQDRLRPGGLFCLRVNHTDTDFVYQHRITERDSDGSYTVRYEEGPKSGLLVHFFSERDLTALFTPNFKPVLPLRRDVIVRSSPAAGQWSQWEAIWKRSR